MKEKRYWVAAGWRVLDVDPIPYEGAWLTFERWGDVETGQKFTRPSDLSESWIDNMAIFEQMEEHL